VIFTLGGQATECPFGDGALGGQTSVCKAGQMSLADVWPLFRLRVTSPTVRLVVPGETELAVLAGLAADGVYDPQNRFLARSPVAGWDGGESPQAELSFLRYYWASLADWSPQRWNLLFAVFSGEECVGVQEIGAQDFALTRTVSTGSWLAAEYQGRGLGREMRAAVLQLAFELGADRAESAVWSDNGPSLGVSRALGYRSNGATVRAYRGRRLEQVNLVLDRSDWAQRLDITVTGLDPATRDLLGVGSL